MSFLRVNKKKVQAQSTGGSSSYATTSGIYDVTIKAVEVTDTRNGATQVNYITDKFMSYGNTVVDTNGNPIFGMDILSGLATILGEEELSNPEPTTVQFKNSSKELMCIPELTGAEVKCWVQFEYQLYKGEIQERVVVKRFYRLSDGATGSEIAKDEDPDYEDKVEFGADYDKDVAYAETVKYSDNLTEEDVKEWKEAKRNDNKGSKAPTRSAGSKFPTRR